MSLGIAIAITLGLYFVIVILPAGILGYLVDKEEKQEKADVEAAVEKLRTDNQLAMLKRDIAAWGKVFVTEQQIYILSSNTVESLNIELNNVVSDTGIIIPALPVYSQCSRTSQDIKELRDFLEEFPPILITKEEKATALLELLITNNN